MSIENFEKSVGLKQEEQVEMEFDDEGNIEIDVSDEPFQENEEFIYSYEEGTHYENLVKYVDDHVLNEIASQVIENVENDENSRSDWLQTLEMGLDLLGIEVEEKNTPFQGACSAQHPLLLEAAVKFQSKASSELLPSGGPVSCKVLGDTTLEKEDQAIRVQKHMNWQLTEEMTEFETDTEKSLLFVPTIGSSFKKSYYEGNMERPVSEIVPADQLIVNNTASDLYRAPRFTHKVFKTKDSLERDFANNFYIKPDNFGEPTEFKRSEFQKKANQIQGMEVDLEGNEGYTLYEQYVDLHIEGLDEENNPNNLAVPYIVTVDDASQKVLGIRRNWRPGDVKHKKKVPFTHYYFVPGFGFYGLGYIHLLGNLQLSLTSSLRSLVDAGQFANLQGGFKLKGVRIVDDDEPISPGEFKEIESAVQDINKALMPLPFKEPSQVLFQMLQFLDGKGQKFADSTEQVIADSTNYGPVGTTMALLDASTKFFSSIHRRLHKAQKHELKLIAEINSETLPDEYFYNVENASMSVKREDYDPKTIDVLPVSDPNISSNAHRMAKAQTMLDIALKVPDQHDMREVLKHVYINMDYTEIDKILPPKEQTEPNDPITDIQRAVDGKPIKAFPEQDNETHIAVKTAFLQDPLTGGSQLMQKAGLIIQANIQEHMIIQYAKQMEATGQEDMAAAAQQVTTLNQQKFQQMQEGQDNPESTKAQASMLLAQSEIMEAENERTKLEMESQFRAAELALKKEQNDTDKAKLIAKMHEMGEKLDHDMEKLFAEKGLDAMIEGLKNKK